MGTTLNRLTVKQIENLPDGMHADGGNIIPHKTIINKCFL